MHKPCGVSGRMAYTVFVKWLKLSSVEWGQTPDASPWRPDLVIWGALSDTKIGTLQKYQNRALDLIESSKVKDAWNKDLMNINQLMTFDRAVMTYKIVNQLCPAGLQNKFIERSVISKYNTRNRKDLRVQKLTLEYTKRGFLYTGPIAWNNIPQPIRDTDSIVRFIKN